MSFKVDVTDNERGQIKRCAELQGLSVSAWAEFALVDAAQRELEDSGER